MTLRGGGAPAPAPAAPAPAAPQLQELVLDAAQDKQWKQIGSDPTGLRLQVRFVKKSRGFAVADVRATIPDAPAALAIGPAKS